MLDVHIEGLYRVDVQRAYLHRVASFYVDSILCSNNYSEMIVSFIKSNDNNETKGVKKKMGRKSKWNWLKDFETVMKWLKKVRVEKGRGDRG